MLGKRDCDIGGGGGDTGGKLPLGLFFNRFQAIRASLAFGQSLLKIGQTAATSRSGISRLFPPLFFVYGPAQSFGNCCPPTVYPTH
jgi:hypothetical protein